MFGAFQSHLKLKATNSTDSCPSGCRRSLTLSANRPISKESASPDEEGTASTATTELSQSARQNKRASLTGRSGASAKKQPPTGHILRGRNRNRECFTVGCSLHTHPRRPGNVIGIASQPFPRPPRAIEFQQRFIRIRIAPVRAQGWGRLFHSHFYLHVATIRSAGSDLIVTGRFGRPPKGYSTNQR